MREVRKIYRAQYLQKLAEVTELERQKQTSLYDQQKHERWKRRVANQQRILDDKKRRAILKDRLRVEQKLTQTIMMAKQSSRKKKLIRSISRAQSSSDYVTGENAEKKLSATDTLFDRNISMPDLLHQLGKSDEIEKDSRKRIKKTDDIYQQILVDSFNILPEDEPQFAMKRKKPGRITSARQRAQIIYSGFTKDEKLRLLDEKIAMIKQKLEDSPDDISLSRLLDELTAHSYHE